MSQAEPPSKRFRSLRNGQSTVAQTVVTEDDYFADGENALESTDWRVSSGSSEWERLSEFSDLDSSEDDSDWEF